MSKTCGFCKHFSSYEEIYEDPLKDVDCGRCYILDEEASVTTIYDTCNNWEGNIDDTTNT